MRRFTLAFALAALFLPSAGRAYVITGPILSTFQGQDAVGGVATLDLDGDGNPDIEVTAFNGGMVFTPDAAIAVPPSSSLLYTGSEVNIGGQVDGSYNAWAPAHDYHLSGSFGIYGFRFTSGGATHYGWGVKNLSIGPGYASASFGPWAYESEPDTPITVGVVPEPAMAGLFLLAGPAVSRRRRSRRRLTVTSANCCSSPEAIS
jgi:hypothetical protein